MMNSRLENAMNEQIKHEMFSSYLYLSMSAYFNSIGLEGMAHWMRIQAYEENLHGMKFFDHINDREGRVHLLAIDQPQTEWSSPLDAWKAAYKHEQFISAKINDLFRLANETGDYASIPLLNWFVTEQIEEEASTSKVAQRLDRIGDSGQGLVMLDNELAARAMPATQAGQQDE